MKRKPITQTEEERLYDAAYPIIMAPWHGMMTPIRVRKLTAVQALSCGDFGMIELFEDKIRANGTPTMEEMAAYADRHDKLCRLSMVKPTYDEAMKIAGSHVDTRDIDAQLAAIQELFDKLDAMPQRDMGQIRKLKEQYAAIELQSKFLLPADFSATIVNYTLGIAESDIKLINEDILYNAAVLAMRGHDNPSDHISGKFTPLMYRELNNRAWIVLDERSKKKGA